MPTPTPLVFGPVPSRRLGRSLGINNVPPKSCSYSCVYCQVGTTPQRTIERRAFHSPEEVVCAVLRRVQSLREQGQHVDYLTFVPDGEPTLDVHLGQEIDRLRSLEVPIAVITNGSLLGNEDVRATLNRTQWVSIKVDAVEVPTWQQVNRPHDALALEQVLAGLRAFSRGFEGELATETMLVRGLNDRPAALESTATFLAELGPAVAYVAVPTRPPSEGWVRAPDEEVVTAAHEIFSRHLPRVELLVGWEGSDFGTSGDAVEDLLAISAVHPLREGGQAHHAHDEQGDGRTGPTTYTLHIPIPSSAIGQAGLNR